MPPVLLDPHWVDPDDGEEIDADWVAAADLYDGEKLVRHGRPPSTDAPRPMVSIQMDADLLERLRASGKGWQTRVNALLREAVEQGWL